MLELVRVNANVDTTAVWSAPAESLVMGLARTNEELEAIQRLRFNVFTEEMNAVFPDAVDGLDADRYDPWCEHVMVKEANSGRVVGTYRFLSPANVAKAGGYYSESEFDISALQGLRSNMAEVGRSCIHADYRNGSVIMLLWSGIATLVKQHGLRYVLGCASVSLRDDGVTAAEVWRSAKKELDAAPEMPRVIPRHRYPVERLNSELPARVPPLIKGYLKLGATICGEPAWDPDFNTADFPVLLDMTRMDDRYRKHFGLA
ncbi:MULTISPECIES: GNAT family N-acetyltransferase [unclassified Pusillimonas]|uniref:GNAT family N-acetyltransferase n=1 Tax=unclassified Pusillimonas TaxID=2640016 RepID=UPI000B9CB3B2|nr:MULTISPECIES: GNAT family N-acyltransferase [unclassified Pusillimonas]OXR49088.1 GNAT family N-acetyltransferase [Pusillimonas sp. T2]ROT45969.1 GNAT family N-acetyltransferase [Pusillimonas sp. NJUB218]